MEGIGNTVNSSGRINAESFLKSLRNKNLSNREKTKAVAKGFESLFVFRLLKEMRKTASENSLFSSGFDKDFFMDIMDQEIAQKVAERRGIGIAKILERELLNENEQIKGENKTIDNVNMNQLTKSGLFEDIKNIIPKDYHNRTVTGRVNKYSNVIKYFSHKYNVETNLIKAVISQESKGKTEAVSKKGAKGLMQLMEKTAFDMGIKDINNPVENIEGGVKYLKKLLDKYNNNTELALAAYNSGPGSVEKYGGIPPYKETRNFVRNVIKYKELFDKGKIF